MLPDIDQSFRDALAGRYTIEREIGRGGMASVYLAHDERHDRPVALKVLDPELAAALGTERFLREIRTAARLQHPHILTVHDSGEAAGLLYYVMPYLDGATLRDRLRLEPQLPLEEAVRITQEVAGALAYAHSRGVVHRDIKPENILFSATDTGPAPALIADFGIAHAMSAGSDALTQRGMTLGTPSYMSPEQASAMTVDGRSDTYALGCVVYEMLAGHPPFLGTSGQEILARHARDPVPPLRTIRPDLPQSIETAVRKALAKSPADRYATTTAFTSALAPADAAPPAWRRSSRIAALAALGVVVLLAAGYAAVLANRVTAPPAASADSSRSIAVLPFNNVGGDTANEPYSDGIADELTTALGKVNGLSVAARQSTFSFKSKGLDPREIGRQLQVRYIVEGRVQTAANRRRVAAQLVDVASGRELWSDNFEHDARNRDVFMVNDSIARSIVRQLLPYIPGAATAAVAKRPTESPEAHDLYLQGRFFFERRSDVGLKKAQEYFEQAIARDSSYALAYAGLSDALSHASVFGYALPNATFPRARSYATRAIELDGDLAAAHSSRAFIALFYDWDWSTAAREFDRALALDPRASSAHLWHAWYYLAMGQVNQAIGEVESAVALDRFSLVNNTRLVTMLFYGRRYDAALAQALKTMDMNPEFVGLRLELARVYTYMGRCREALAVLADDKPTAAASVLLGVRGYAFAKCGDRAAAVAEIARLQGPTAAPTLETHYGLAVIHAGLGNTAQAIAELEKAYAARSWSLIVLRLDQAFDGLRSDPRFMALERRMAFIS